MKEIIKYMDKWYSCHWFRDSLLLLACLVILPVIVGSII